MSGPYRRPELPPEIKRHVLSFADYDTIKALEEAFSDPLAAPGGAATPVGRLMAENRAIKASQYREQADRVAAARADPVRLERALRRLIGPPGFWLTGSVREQIYAAESPREGLRRDVDCLRVQVNQNRHGPGNIHPQLTLGVRNEEIDMTCVIDGWDAAYFAGKNQPVPAPCISFLDVEVIFYEGIEMRPDPQNSGRFAIETWSKAEARNLAEDFAVAQILDRLWYFQATQLTETFPDGVPDAATQFEFVSNVMVPVMAAALSRILPQDDAIVRGMDPLYVLGGAV